MNQHSTVLLREFGSRPIPMVQRKNVCTDIGMIQQFYKDYGMVASPASLEYVWDKAFNDDESHYHSRKSYRQNILRWREIARRMDLIVNG